MIKHSFNILFRLFIRIEKRKSQVSTRRKYREITINKLHDRESRGPCYYQTVPSIMLLSYCNFPNIIMIVSNVQSPPTIYHLPQSTCQIVVPCSRSTRRQTERSFIQSPDQTAANDLSLFQGLIDYPRFGNTADTISMCLWQTIVACFNEVKNIEKLVSKLMRV